MLRADGVRIERRKAPVLAAREEEIGRRAGGNAFREMLAIAPRVVAVRIHAERKIEIEPEPAALRVIGDGAHLLRHPMLNVEVIANALVVLVRERHRTRGFAAVVLARSLRFTAGAELRVLVCLTCKFVEGVIRLESRGERFEEPSFRGDDAFVVDAIGVRQFFELLAAILRQFANLEIQLIPEKAADRRVRTRIFVHERRCHRKRGHDSATELIDPFAVPLEIAEVADAPGFACAHRIDGREDAPRS